MKKIFFLFLFSFCATFVFAQTPYPNSTKISNDSTIYGINGATLFKDGFIITSYRDTASANLKHIKYYKGFEILIGRDIYFRDSISPNRALWRWTKSNSGASTITISNDSSALYICNNSACDTFLFSSIAPIQNFTILNDTTILVCGISSCDTLHTVPTFYNDKYVNSVRVDTGAVRDTIVYTINGVDYIAGTVSNGAGASNISIFNDSTLLICNLNGCDTFYFPNIAPIINFTVLSDTTIQVCGVSACDTLKIPPTNFNDKYVTSVGVDSGQVVDTVTYTINGVKHIGGYILGSVFYTQLPLYVDSISEPGKKILKILQPDGIISGCIVSWSGNGLVYYVSPCVAQINGTVYSAPQNTITLATADPTYSRQDLFIMDTTSVTSVLTGTPSPSPTVPQTNIYQLPLTTGITINPGDTIPSGSGTTFHIVYDENLGTAGGEYNATKTGTATVNFADASIPFHLTKDIFVSLYNTGTTLNFAAATEKTLNTGDVLNLHIYTNGNFKAKNNIYAYFEDAGVAVTNTLPLTSYGMNKNNGNIYQNVSIAVSAFQWSNNFKYDKIKFLLVGSDNTGTNGFFMDYINIQGGTPNIPPATDYSNKVDSTTMHKINDSTYVGLYWVKGISYQKGDTIKIHAGSGGGGTVTQFNFTNSAGVAGTVTNATTTPTLSLVIDTAAISNFYAKVRSLLNPTSPIIYSNGNISLDTTIVHTTNYNNTLYGSLSQQNTNTSNIATNTANIALKVNYTDTTSMLSHYLNNVGYGLTKSGQIVILDSSKYATAVNSGILKNTDWSKFTNKTDSVSLNAGGDSLIVIKNNIRLAYKLPAGGGGSYTANSPITLTGSAFGADTTKSVGKLATYTDVAAKQDSMNIYMPEKYGAKGDGVTDDAAAFTAMIAAMPARGGHVNLMSKTYLINSTITVNKSIWFEGNGMADSIDANATRKITKIIGGTDNMVLFRVVEDHVSFTDMALASTSGSTTSGCGIRIDSNTRRSAPVVGFYLNRVTFNGFFNQVEATGAYGWGITNCLFMFIENYGIYVSNAIVPDAGDSYITGCRFIPKNASTIAAIYQTSSGGLRISNNKFNWNSSTRGKYCYLGAISGTSDLLISNNSFENYSISAIKLNGPTTYFANITINGNQFAAIATGTRPDITIDSCSGVSIQGNVFRKGSANDTAILLTTVQNTNISNAYNGYGVPVAYLGTNTNLMGDGGSPYTALIYDANGLQRKTSFIKDSLGVINLRLRYTSGSLPTNYITDGTGPTQLSFLSSYGTGGALDASVINSNTSGGGITFWQQTGASAATLLMRLKSNGRVGIGTLLPNAPLDILSTTEPLRLSYDASNYGNFTVASNGVMTISGSSTKVRINNLGIGTSAPNQALDVRGIPLLGGTSVTTITGLDNSGQMAIGWNKNSGSGDIALIGNRGAGSAGGFSFWDYSNSDAYTHLLDIGGTGIVTHYNTIKPVAGTTTFAPIIFTSGTNMTTPTAGALEYSDPQLSFVNTKLVRQEIPQIQQKVISTQVDATSNSAAPVSVFNTSISGTYRFEGTFYTTSDPTAGIKFQLSANGSSLTTTNFIYEAIVYDAGAIVKQQRVTSLSAAAWGVTAVSNACIKISGTITTNVAGTLTILFGQNVTNATASSILVGSTFVVTQMN